MSCPKIRVFLPACWAGGTSPSPSPPALIYSSKFVEVRVLGSSSLARYHAAMPLTQPQRDNPLMRRYFQQIYMARKRNVGADNAEKISRGMATILRLSEEARLLLKAEIIGHPGNLVRAWFGDVSRAARLLDVPVRTAEEILDPEKSITYKSGVRALEKLREMNAPSFVVESVERRLMPPAEPRRGLITHDLHGPELGRRYVETKESLRHGKPKTHRAISESGLMLKEIRRRAGVGKETMRKALYKHVGGRSARSIAEIVGEVSGLSESEMAAIEEELKEPPQKNF